jgi:hypothetical protein
MTSSSNFEQPNSKLIIKFERELIKIYSFEVMKFTKQLISVFLLIGLLTNCFSYSLLSSSSYAVNKTYISTVLCSNKAHVEMHCEGKCFMDIKLKELEQKNKHEQDQLKRIIETLAPKTISLLVPVLETLIEGSTSNYLQKKPTNIAQVIFQPPKAA